MAKLQFTDPQVEQGYALYAAQGTGGGGNFAYFLWLPAGGTPPQTLGLLDAWAAPGAFVFSTQALSGPLALAQQLELRSATSTRAIAWMTTPAPTILPLSYLGPTGGNVAGNGCMVAFGNVVLQIPPLAAMALAEADGTAAFTSNQIQLLRNDGTGPNGLNPDAALTLEFGASLAGRFTFGAGWDSFDFYQLFTDDPVHTTAPLGGVLRYYYPDTASATGYSRLAYPVLAPPPDPGVGALTLPMDAEMDPLAPFDGTRTRFRFLAGKVPPEVTASYASTTNGTAVPLTPLAQGEDRAGFWLARRPGPTAGSYVYLAPLGPFAVGLAQDGGKLMCGTSGTEYLRAAAGDVLELVPNQPALASAFGSDVTQRVPLAHLLALGVDADPPPPLEPEFTTAWAVLRPGGGPVPRAYFAQPNASVNYTSGTLPVTMTYPAAVASHVAGFGLTGGEAAGSAAGVAFPLVPYGGIYQPQDGTPAADLFARFEKQVLASVRGARLRGTTPASPVFASDAGAPLKGARTATPQGLLVQLNDGSTKFGLVGAELTADGADDPPAGEAGTWRQVLLARSGAQHLSFDADPATGVVDPTLASTLVKDQLFMVLNDWSRFTAISRKLSVAGFNFEITPDQDDPAARQTILVFKYSTAASLTDLVHTPEAWAQPAYFIGGQQQVADAQATLIAALKVAQDSAQDPDDPFVYFRTVVAAEPGWTGLLAFNAPINGNGMPADLQMLFAGIDGQLKAHHFGVEVNRITRPTGTAGAPPQIEESSFFGVIHYPPPEPSSTSFPGPHDLAAPAPAAGPSPYGFMVQELNVAIRNSVVTDFHARVGMTINELFSRGVQLTGKPTTPPNTVSIAGQYQKTGAVGTVTFNASESGAFSFDLGDGAVRVLDSFTVTRASLVPQDSKPLPDGGSQVRSRFTLGGELAFRQNPFPHVEGLDLYSYGKTVGTMLRGVPLSGLVLGISFELDKDGKRTKPTEIAPDFSNVLASDNREAVRPDGLVSRLPLKLTGFMQNPAGLSASKLGGVAANVVQLQGGLVEVPSGTQGDGGGNLLPGAVGDGSVAVVRAEDDPPEATVTKSASYTTSAPTYALQFQLPMGSLGGLADAHASLDAGLVLGWGPSTYTPDNDGAGVFMQLPQISAGALGFNLQGLIKTTFGDANLMQVEVDTGSGKQSVYVVLFNNVALSVLGIRLPPQVITNFILFAGAPGKDDPASSNLGWSLAATQVGQST